MIENNQLANTIVHMMLVYTYENNRCRFAVQQLMIIMAVFEAGKQPGEIIMTATEVLEVLKHWHLSILGGDMCG